MGELIVAVDPVTGLAVGVVDKDVAHREGLWHANIHVWILDREGAVLLQQRSPSKATLPGLWDISAAGHIRPGEDGLREVEEELGVAVRADQLEQVGILTIDQDLPGFRNRERPRVYLWRSDLSLSDFTFSDGEVVALAAVSLRDLAVLREGVSVTAPVWRDGALASETVDGAAMVPFGQAYWDALLTYLR